MKKTVIIGIIFVCTAFCLIACQTLIKSMDEPKVSLQSVNLAGADFNGANLMCKLRVENPNSFDIPFPEIGWKLFLNSNNLVNGTVKNNNRLKAKQSTFVDVPVSFEYLKAFNSIASLKGRNAANYKIALAVKFPIPIIRNKAWNFEHDGTVPLPQIPKLSAPSFRVEGNLRNGYTLVSSVNIENPNSFNLPAPKINLDYQVNRTSIAKSNTTANSLRANSTTPVTMRMNINQTDLVRVLGSSALTGSSLNGNLVSSFDFGVPAFGKDPTTLNIPGTLSLR